MRLEGRLTRLERRMGCKATHCPACAQRIQVRLPGDPPDVTPCPECGRIDGGIRVTIRRFGMSREPGVS